MSIPVDVTFHASWWHKHAGIDFSQEFFDEPDYRIECDLKMRKTLYEKFGHLGLGEKDPKPRPIMGSDLLASGYLYSAIMGCNIRFFANTPPEVICANLSDEEIEALEELDISKNKVWQDTIRQFEYLKNKYGYVESHINLQGIQNIAMDLRGSELFIDYMANPALANKLINRCTDLTLQIGKYIASNSKVLSHGVTAITSKTMPNAYVTSNCTVEMVSQKTYEKFLLEPDIKLAKYFKPFGIHHCGQSMEHVIEGYAKVENLVFAEVGAGSDIARVRQTLPQTWLNLRYSPVKIMTASDHEIATDIEAMSKSAGKLYSMSCVGIDSETEDQRVETFITCVKNLKR
jgi:uroporphyrinogen-III decarboxylase